MKSMQLATMCALLSMALNGWAQDTPKPVPKPAVSKHAAKAPADTAPAAAKTNGQRGNDQLTLDATLVTGNRELPKVMYIVPWKKADLSNLPGQPFNTLIDEALAPVDREVFRREVTYYDVVADKDHAGVKSASDAPMTSSADKK
jgi:hypothetical protein